MSSAGLLPDRASGERSPVYKKKENENKKVTHLGAPGVVEPHSGSVVVVPLSLCPWYLQSVMMYAKSWSCNHASAGVGAALLRVLGTCQVVLVDIAPGAFGRVRSFNGRTRKLP